MKIPQQGMSKEEIFKTLKSYKNDDLDWKSGRVFGYIYDPGAKVHDVINDAYTLYLSENGVDPLSFPSLLRLENEVVSMTANLLGCDREVVGNFSSGGTEIFGPRPRKPPVARATSRARPITFCFTAAFSSSPK